MNNNLIIAIPSYQRYASIGKKRCTFDHIPPSLYRNTVFYVEEEELAEYRKMLPEQVTVKSCSIADAHKKWGSIMDLILDECSQSEHLIIMDDDLTLFHRSKLKTTPSLNTKLTHKMFERMVQDLSGITNYETPLTSIQYRQWCHTKSSPTEMNTRISMIWSLNSEFLRKNPQFRFYRSCKLDFMTDYYFFLSLLRAGIPNKVLNQYTKNDVPNARGGESSKRTLRMLNGAAKKLAGMFHGYVATYTKFGKNNWQDGMLGVRLQTNKLYQATQCKIERTP